MGEWWSLDNNYIKIYTENLENISKYPTPPTIHYQKQDRRKNTCPVFAVEYITKMGSKEQKQMFKDFGIKLKDKRRD